MEPKETIPGQNEVGVLSSKSSRYVASKILVVDDQPVNVALLQAVLTDTGYKNVQALTDSRNALDICESFEPDLVLLDLMMPHVDGFAILEGLRSKPSKSSLPVMVLTADENNDTRDRAMQAGANDFILKPFNLAEVLFRIAGLLAERYATIQCDRSDIHLNDLNAP